MFKHILLPTDGSPLSEATVREGVQFAKVVGAKVTGLYVIPKNQPFYYDMEVPSDAQLQISKRFEELAKSVLSAIEEAAKGAGVPCEVVTGRSDSAYDAIIRIAESKGCDLIIMASHGRKGAVSLLLGSETQKVLTHSQIPVLVFR
jgi:nucleotide-binding universal stress UspA family protein